MSAEATRFARQPRNGVILAGPGSRGRPWSLTVLWVCLMAPFSLAGTALQPHCPVPYTVFPLVMVGPAAAAVLCRLAVPGWFPADAPRAAAARLVRSVIAIGVASAAFVAVIVSFSAGRAMILPEHLAAPPAIAAVIVGLAVGSLCEEIGYRGVMFRALSARLRPMSAVAVNGVFFGMCHVQYLGNGWLPVILFLLATVFLDLVMVAGWTGAWWQRVLIAAFFHAVVNVGLQLVGVGLDRMGDFVGLALAVAAAAFVAVILGRVLGIGEFPIRHT